MARKKRTTAVRGCAADQKGVVARLDGVTICLDLTHGSGSTERRKGWMMAHGQIR